VSFSMLALKPFIDFLFNYKIFFNLLTGKNRNRRA